MAGRQDRDARLAAALRENLRRRKAQVRERTAEERPKGGDDAPRPDVDDSGDGDD